MQERHLFEYAIIRVVPRVEREEFINVGVILYCAKQKFLKAAFFTDQDRLKALYPSLNQPELIRHMEAFARISAAAPGSGPIGQLDAPSRFRWLTAMRSTVLQTSRVHPGFCGAGAAEKLEQLMKEQVL